MYSAGGTKITAAERSGSYALLVATIISVPLIVAFCMKYVSVEDPVYIWDYGAYWHFFQTYGDLISSGSSRWQQRVLDSVANSDYNPSAVIPLYPFYRLLGGARESYIIAVSLCYLLPAVVIATSLALKTAHANGNAVSVLAFIAALTYLPFWAPTLRGMVDIVGLIFLGIATLIVLRSDFLSRKPFVNAVILGLVLWAPFLFRRWYAYSILAFFLVTYLFGLFSRWRGDRRNWHEFAILTLILGLSGSIVLICIWLFQWGLAERVISTSYAELYAAYQIPFLAHFEVALRRVGWYIAVIIAVGIATSFIAFTIEALFCLMCATFTFLLFIRTQGMGLHHFLPVAFWLFPIYFTGLNTVARKLTFLPDSLRTLPLAAISIVIFAFGVSSSLERRGLLGDFFIPAGITHPLHLDNLPEYRKLIADLQSDLKSGDRFVVFASSSILSDELLVTLQPSLASSYIRAPHNANRDFFPFEMLRAKYAIAVTPPQTHQAPGSQRNITVPGTMLLEGEGFGAAYERIGVYMLANDATAYLLRLQRAVTVAEVTNLINKLVTIYPGGRDKFRKSMVVSFTARVNVLGDIWGRSDVLNPTTLFLHPGANQPTKVSLPMLSDPNKRPSSVEFSMNKELLNQCTGADGVRLWLSLDGNSFWNGTLIPGERINVNLPKTGQAFSIILDKQMQPSCDHVLAKFVF